MKKRYTEEQIIKAIKHYNTCQNTNMEIVNTLIEYSIKKEIMSAIKHLPNRERWEKREEAMENIQKKNQAENKWGGCTEVHRNLKTLISLQINKSNQKGHLRENPEY